MEPIARASSAWFASLVALLVALGAQTLLDGIVPANLSQFNTPSSSGAAYYRVSGESLWVADIIIRVLSFAMGGFVGVLLARVLSGRLLALLLFVTVLATVFQQFPGRASVLWLILWSVAGSIGVLLGAWAANAKRRAA